MRVLSRISIQRRFVVLFGAAVLGFLSFSSLISTLTRDNQALLNSVVQERLPTAIDIAEKLSTSLRGLNKSLVQLVLSTHSKSLSIETLNAVKAADREVLMLLSKLRELNQRQADSIQGLADSYSGTMEQLMNLMQDVLAGLESAEEVQGKVQSCVDRLSQIEQDVQDLKGRYDQTLQSAITEASRGNTNAYWANIWLLICAIPFSVFYFLSVSDISKALQGFSTQLRDSSQSMLAISDDALASSTQLGEMSIQQAESVSNIFISTNQIQEMIFETMKSSAVALASADTSFKEAKGGSEVMANLKISAVEIEAIYAELEDLVEIVRQIRIKTDVINHIVFKTQLLSFNASIEAARAGSQGKGFSVVAQEVGNLAKLSGTAASEIGGLLDSSARRVEETVRKTKDRITGVHQMSQQAAQYFEVLTQKAGEVNERVSLIHRAASQQNKLIDSIVRAMNDLRKGSLSLNAVAQLVLRLSGTLKSQSRTLETVVKNLNQLIRGQKLGGQDLVELRNGHADRLIVGKGQSTSVPPNHGDGHAHRKVI